MHASIRPGYVSGFVASVHKAPSRRELPSGRTHRDDGLITLGYGETPEQAEIDALARIEEYYPDYLIPATRALDDAIGESAQ